MERTCETCRYHDDFTWVCFNGDSPACADYTSNGFKCSCWKEKDPETEMEKQDE